MTARRFWCDSILFAMVCLAGVSGSAAEPTSVTFLVSETAGLRRFSYPVTLSWEAPLGVLRDVSATRLVDESSSEVVAQVTKLSTWPDGSVRQLDIDFAPSLGPLEARRYRLDLGRAAERRDAQGGFRVEETADELVVASSAIRHRLRRDGRPLLASVAFGEHEFIGMEGVRCAVAPGPARIVKPGPFNVTLDFGDLRLEYVHTKSWVKIVQRVSSSQPLSVDAHFALSKSPLTWDFGAGSWLYGSLAKPSDRVILRRGDGRWRIESPPGVAFAAPRTFDGCGHLADSNRVAAFAIADPAAATDDRSEPASHETASSPRIELDGAGRVRIAAARRELTVYFHWVAQPIPVTAVTSPQSMVAPLEVKLLP